MFAEPRIGGSSGLPVAPRVDPRRLALPPQQDEQPAIAETPPFVGKVTQPAA
jgi:hypothetical protein